jgi:hypothetical protein
LLAGANDFANLLAKGSSPYTQKMVGLPHFKLLEEDIIQVDVIVLAGVHQHVLA